MTMYLFAYLFDVYGGILKLLIIIAGVMMVITGTAFMMMIDNHAFRDYDGNADYKLEYKSYYYLAKRVSKIAGIIAVIFILLSVFLPSKQGLAMLGGVYIGKQVYEQMDSSDLTKKAVKVLDVKLNSYLDEMLEEDKPSKKD